MLIDEHLEESAFAIYRPDDEVGVENSKRLAAVEFAQEVHGSVSSSKDTKVGFDIFEIILIESLSYEQRG